MQKLLSKSILIVGLTKAGKSTLFNYILHNKLIGVRGEDGVTTYEVSVKNADVAPANNGIESVTTIPNITTVGQLSLTDMPGYMDTRLYVKVIGVSYVLKAVLNKIQ